MLGATRQLTHRVPCLPPLFGLTKTNSGMVPEGGVIWKELELSAYKSHVNGRHAQYGRLLFEVVSADSSNSLIANV